MDRVVTGSFSWSNCPPSRSGPEDAARLQELFTAARSADRTELLADCGKFETEIAKESRDAKFTLAELEEEELSLERLRRRRAGPDRPGRLRTA
ncbi:Chromate resistance protein ChrB [Streptomyces sp. JNUCC 63]